MLYLDSWVWLEFFAEDEQWEVARSFIEQIGNKSAVISTIVLLEVKYRSTQKFTSQQASKIIRIIESFDDLMILPVTAEVAKESATLRNKYYELGSLEMSYGDAIHLATAKLSDCRKFITGDPDFQNVENPDVELIG